MKKWHFPQISCFILKTAQNTAMWSIVWLWCHFRLPWTSHNPYFKVTPVFDANISVTLQDRHSWWNWRGLGSNSNFPKTFVYLINRWVSCFCRLLSLRMRWVWVMERSVVVKVLWLSHIRQLLQLRRDQGVHAALSVSCGIMMCQSF